MQKLVVSDLPKLAAGTTAVATVLRRGDGIAFAVVGAKATAIAGTDNHYPTDITDADEYFGFPDDLSAMRRSGPPTAISRICYGKMAAGHEAECYVHAAAPEFLTCTRCYHLYIEPTRFHDAGLFSTVRRSGAVCNFHWLRLGRPWACDRVHGVLLRFATLQRAGRCRAGRRHDLVRPV